MKKVITFLLILSFLSVKIFAQTAQNSVSGTIVNDKNKPVEAATISLMKAADSSLFKISVTDKAGKFSFQDIPLGSYYINASALSYVKLNSTVFELNSTSLTHDMDAIVLQEEAKSLNSVTVTAKKPLIEQMVEEEELRLQRRSRGKRKKSKKSL